MIVRESRRRIGDDPHCRKCGYLLLGLQSERCPECGATLSPDAIVRGAPRPRWKAFRPKWLFLIFLGLVLIVSQTPLLQSFNWYQFKPTYFVLWDLKSPSAVDVQRAWTELIARDQAGSLSAGSRDAMVRFALARQANGPAPPTAFDNAVVDYLAARCTAGNLPADQQKTFFDQSVRTFPLLRATVVSGDPLPYGVGYQVSIGSHSNFSGNVAYSDCSIDGKIVSGSPGAEGEFSSPGGGFASNTSTNCPPVGKHAFGETLHVEIFGGSMRRPPGGPALFTTTRVLTGSFEVVPAGSKDVIKALFDPSRQAAVEAAVSTAGFAYAHGSRQLNGSINFTNPPVDLAFDVFVRYGGKEFPMGQVNCRGAPGMDGYGIVSVVSDPAPKQIDVILRPSRAAAAGTVGLYSYWNKEMVFKSVPVKEN
jgi:hypothetical protein